MFGFFYAFHKLLNYYNRSKNGKNPIFCCV